MFSPYNPTDLEHVRNWEVFFEPDVNNWKAWLFGNALLEYEHQLAVQLQTLQVEPLVDTILNLFTKPLEDHYSIFNNAFIQEKNLLGVCSLSTDGQIVLDIRAGVLNTIFSSKEYNLRKTFYHEYGHGLFVRALLKANKIELYNSDSNNFESHENQILLEQLEAEKRTGSAQESIIEEALVEFFACEFTDYRALWKDGFSGEVILVPFDQLLNSKDESPHLSLLNFLLILVNPTNGGRKLIKNILENYSLESKQSLLDCLDKAIQLDKDLNPEHLSLTELYEQVRIQS